MLDVENTPDFFCLFVLERPVAWLTLKSVVPCAIHILIDFLHAHSLFPSQYKDINQNWKGK